MHTYPLLHTHAPSSRRALEQMCTNKQAHLHASSRKRSRRPMLIHARPGNTQALMRRRAHIPAGTTHIQARKHARRGRHAHAGAYTHAQADAQTHTRRQHTRAGTLASSCRRAHSHRHVSSSAHARTVVSAGAHAHAHTRTLV